MEADTSVIYRRVGHTAWRTIAGEHILVDLKRLQMYGLNETAVFLWHRLDGAKDSQTLATALQATDSSCTLTAADVSAYCRRLAAEGLVEVVPGASSDPGAPAAEAPAMPARFSPPEILWQEAVRQPPGSCAFLPAQNPLCTGQPFS